MYPFNSKRFFLAPPYHSLCPTKHSVPFPECLHLVPLPTLGCFFFFLNIPVFTPFFQPHSIFPFPPPSPSSFPLLSITHSLVDVMNSFAPTSFGYSTSFYIWSSIFSVPPLRIFPTTTPVGSHFWFFLFFLSTPSRHRASHPPLTHGPSIGYGC